MNGALADASKNFMTPSFTRRRRPMHRSRAWRGYTLIELLVVVAMIGILAALALVGYRKYILSAQTSEATAMLQSIRVAQESYKSEALSYLPVSAAQAGDSLYPRTQTELNSEGDRKAAWVYPTHAEAANWVLLNVSSSGPVRFSYSCVTGLPGVAAPTADLLGQPNPVWSNATASGVPADPWFVAAAVANRDGDANYAVLQTASFTTEIFVHDDTE